MPFNVALSGLNAATADLEVISNNIANVNTTGFKGSRAEFADLFAASSVGSGRTQAGSGVRLVDVAQNFSQGSIEYTSSGLDMAVTGEGFFTLKNDSGYTYTRAGNFQVDQNGNVVSPQGGFLQVYPPNGAGGFDTGSLSNLTISSMTGAPQATDSATFNLNLPASDTPPANTPFDPNDPQSYNRSSPFTVYDSLGATHSATVYYVNSAPGQWTANLYIDGTSVGSQPIAFDQNGALTTPAGGQLAFTGFTPTNGAAPMDITIDMSAVTQYGDTWGPGTITQNGYAPGQVTGIDIDQNGVVSAKFSNGQTKDLGQLALADFENAQGLKNVGNTQWVETAQSGQVIRGAAGTGDFGAIQSGALEDSNVDLTSQLVNMIKAQRNYQANAQSISTDDKMTQTILNIRN
ncbi:MAG TPA: flagellar hook protein FlgE [Rhodanobacteraceae bacterium]|nr:flagellar hook protein FlgE [Rhodanobacteraceae bacterium]